MNRGGFHLAAASAAFISIPGSPNPKYASASGLRAIRFATVEVMSGSLWPTPSLCTISRPSRRQASVQNSNHGRRLLSPVTITSHRVAQAVSSWLLAALPGETLG